MILQRNKTSPQTNTHADSIRLGNTNANKMELN